MSTSSSETGHAVNISNYKLLADTCAGFGTDYNPSNDDILLANMLAQWNTAKTANADLSKAEQAMKEPINQRNILFEPLGKLVTKVMGALNSSKANELVKKNTKTIADAIRNIRKRKPKDAATGATDPADELSAVSTSHQSFVQRATALLSLVNLLGTVKEYKPNEEPLQVANLAALQKKLEEANDGIGAILDSGSKALLTRNRTLYKPGSGMLDTAQACRDYVKSVYGSQAAEYKKVTIIKFRDLPKKAKAKL